MTQKKLAIRDLIRKKENKEKITFITSYDFQIARLADHSGIDMILVGDSAGNNMLGYADTRPVTMDEMIMLSKAVRKGAPHTFIVGDMPFGSYQTSEEEAVKNAVRFIKESEMDAVKCEGGARVYPRVKAMNDAGIAVMGHIGYTPQSTNLESRVGGDNLSKFETLYKDAISLQEAGAFSILLEAVPNKPAGLITQHLKIPIYGIGAGRDVDGVLAIVNDVIGLGNFKAKFVKNFCNVEELIKSGISDYIKEIKENKFPADDHLYSIKEEEEKKIEEYLQHFSAEVIPK